MLFRSYGRGITGRRPAAGRPGDLGRHDYYPPHVGHFSVSAKADDYVTADGELQVTGPDPTPTPTPTPCPHLIFVASSATIAAGASPSHPVGGCTYGFTYPENVNIGIDACRDGTGWHCILVSLAGNYSKQARLLPGQQEVTGPGGNTSRMNFCPQATELNALGGCPGIWYMLRAVEDHESVHEGHFLPAFRTVAPQIETEIETLGVPDTGQSAAEAIAAIQALPGFTNGTAHAQQLWLGEILNLAAGDHSGPTDAAEHAVVDPMVTAICASSSILGTCPVCPTPTPTPSATP